MNAGRHTADLLGLVSGTRGGNGNLRITVADDEGPIRGAKIEFKKGDEDFGYARTERQGVANSAWQSASLRQRSLRWDVTITNSRSSSSPTGT